MELGLKELPRLLTSIFEYLKVQLLILYSLPPKQLSVLSISNQYDGVMNESLSAMEAVDRWDTQGSS